MGNTLRGRRPLFAFVTLAFVVLVAWLIPPMERADAACRPITIRDLPPLPSDKPAPATPTTTIADGTESGGTEGGETTTTVAEQPPPKPKRAPHSCYVYRMQWPVLGGETGSSFGAPRDGGARRHLGVDIFAPKMTPVVAVADGLVTEVNGPGQGCCWVKLLHNDGWWSVYVHLNNDTYLTDDGLGNGLRPGLEAGDRVVAGEVLGWLGDSGNAETASPHLHFELRMRNGTPIDPLPSLRWAQRNSPVPALEGASRQYGIAFVDDDGREAERVFNLLASLGGFWPCDYWGVMTCPDDLATPDDAASWLTTLTGVLVTVRPDPADLTVSEENALMAANLACINEQCPPPSITVGEAAAMIRWSLDWAGFDPESELAPPPTSFETVDPLLAWTRLVDMNLATDCSAQPVTLDRVLTRGELAEMLGRATDHLPVLACSADVS